MNLRLEYPLMTPSGSGIKSDALRASPEHGREPAAAPPRRRFWRKKRYWIPAVLVLAFVLLVGPWPIYTAGYQGTPCAEATFARIEAFAPAGQYGPLLAGFWSRDITPSANMPMAGYSARSPNTATGHDQKLNVKALTLSAGGRTVTIVSGDWLLVMPELRREVLRRVGGSPEDIYFTATHTHSGPGGYSSRWVDQIVLGSYNEGILRILADMVADAIQQSRRAALPASLAFGVGELPADQPIAVNRLDRAQPALNRVEQLTIADLRSGAVTRLVIASPHPTCLGASNRQFHGDYPGLLQQKLGGTERPRCMFAAGAVGSMVCAQNDLPGPRRAAAIAERIAAALPPAEPPSTQSSVLIQSGMLDVDLPPRQYRITQGLRLSPAAAAYLHNGRTYIHVLRVRLEGARTNWDDIVFLGMPADYSGELAMRLAEQAQGLGLTPIVTSFNGDYVGYLLPQERYWLDNHETLGENLCGPWGGEYFHEISLRTLRRLKNTD